MSHTPGPWKAFSDSITVHTTDQGMIYNPTNMVCTVSAMGDAAMERANARLIAAAPELLEALILFVEKGKLKVNLETMLEFSQAYSAACSAIVKATGSIEIR